MNTEGWPVGRYINADTEGFEAMLQNIEKNVVGLQDGDSLENFRGCALAVIHRNSIPAHSYGGY